jgi:hypothetical protein
MGSIWNSNHFLFEAGSLKGKSRKEIDDMRTKWKNVKRKKQKYQNLTEWEVAFLKNISKYKVLTYKQQEVLERINRKNNSQT